jgi:hypothetical protein
VGEGLPEKSPVNESSRSKIRAIYPQRTHSCPFNPRFLPPKYPKLWLYHLHMTGRLDWKLRRIAAGYRQQDIAARVGITSTRYSVLERGEAEPKDWEDNAVEKLLPPLPQAVPASGVSEKAFRAGV